MFLRQPSWLKKFHAPSIFTSAKSALYGYFSTAYEYEPPCSISVENFKPFRAGNTPKHSTPSPYPCIDSFDVMSSLEIKSWLHVWAATKVYAKHLTETVNVDHYRWWKLVCVQIWFDHLRPYIYYGNQLTIVVQNTPDRKTTPELSPTRQR